MGHNDPTCGVITPHLGHMRGNDCTLKIIIISIYSIKTCHGTALALEFGIVGMNMARASSRKATSAVWLVGCAVMWTGCVNGTSNAVHSLKSPKGMVLTAPASTNNHTAWKQDKRGGFVGGETQHTYPLTITAPAVVRIALNDISKGQDYDLFLLTDHGRELYFSRTLDNRGEYIETGFLSPGTYRIAVLNYQGNTSTRAYRLSVEVYGSKETSHPATSNTTITRDRVIHSPT